MTEINETNGLPCGHPRGCIVQDTEGTAHCAWCEEVARLRASLAKQIHKRQSEVANALLARDSVDGTIAEWYDECQSEVERLRMIVDQDGTAHLPCQHCGKNVATPTLESVELCFECWERLRALIPDAGMLDWLVKAAHRWWKDNGGEGTQKDIEAGYALVKELYREENIGER